jgi:hypothetical protein
MKQSDKRSNFVSNSYYWFKIPLVNADFWQFTEPLTTPVDWIPFKNIFSLFKFSKFNSEMRLWRILYPRIAVSNQYMPCFYKEVLPDANIL